jgi:hypothetical protein
MAVCVSTSAARAVHVDLDRGFREGKKAGSVAELDSIGKKLAEKDIQKPFEMGKIDMSINDKSLHLKEDGVAQVPRRLISIYFAGRNNPQGRFVFFHHPDIDGSGMGSKQMSIIDVESIALAS